MNSFKLLSPVLGYQLELKIVRKKVEEARKPAPSPATADDCKPVACAFACCERERVPVPRVLLPPSKSTVV